MKFICWHAPCSQYFPAGEETIKPIHGEEEVQTMKKLAGMAAVAAGLAFMVLSRVSLAAEKQEVKAPEYGTLENQEALETGSLPSESGAFAVQSSSEIGRAHV